MNRNPGVCVCVFVCVCVCEEEKGRVIYVLPEFTSDYMGNLPGQLERRKEERKRKRDEPHNKLLAQFKGQCS